MGERKKAPRRETGLEKWAVKEAKKRGMRLPKWNAPGNNGVPDRILLGTNGAVTFMEFKAEGKPLSPLQVLWRLWLEENNHPCHKVDTKEQFLMLLRAAA